MKVTLRQREKNSQKSLYLEYYHKGKRQYEYLRLYLASKPKTREQREQNKKTLELAETIRAKRQIEIQNGIFGINDLERLNSNFLTYFEILAEKRKESDGNYGNWISTLKHLKKFPKGNVRFSDITKHWLDDLKYYLVHEAQTKGDCRLSQNTCSSYYNKVCTALKEAVKDGYLQRNPAEEVDGIKDAEVKKEFLTLDELQKVAKTHCEMPVIKSAFLFSSLTGLRFSDIEKLTWQEIQHSDENGYYIRFKQKKTKGQETLPISADAIQLLGDRKAGDDKVFTDLTYNAYNNQKITEWMVRAGIEKHITFHCARHTYATLQLSLGTDIYTVSKLLGHKSLKTTEVYAKIIDEKKKEAANKIKLKK